MKKLAWFLSFSVGFLSISQEILWVRVVGFLLETLPQAFSFVLGMFLAGIAAGAIVGKKICQGFQSLERTSGFILLLAGGLDLSLVGLIRTLVDTPLALPGLGVLIILSAMVKGAIFPIAHHMGSTPDSRLGRSVSRVYFMNILGSTLGPLVTGLILMDVLSITASFQALACGTLAVSAVALLAFGRSSKSRRVSLLAFLLGGLTTGLSLQIESRDSMLIRALLGPEVELKHVIENRHGIIHVVEGGGSNDTVYGGNVYDGKPNISLVSNQNRIDRAYLLAGLHPAPRRVLMIGLSTGAWARVLSAHPGLEAMEIVEINPGYIELIRKYPQLSPLLEDSRISIHFDDGRRWLRRHSDAKFDVIVMNTTFHWRANTTNLVSREMQEMIRAHLNQGGIFAFNATGSDDVFYTTSVVFKHAYRYRNFIYASDMDFRERKQGMSEDLLKLRLEKTPIFDAQKSSDLVAMERMMSLPFVGIQEAAANQPRMLEEVTDQNMITEFKFGRSLF